MGLFSRSVKNVRIEPTPTEAPVITIDSVHQGFDYLLELVKQIRPSKFNNHKEADLKFKALFYKLQNEPAFLYRLRKAIISQFLNSNFVPALTQSGMVGSRGFLQEFMTKVKHKLLPPLLQPNDFLYVINHIFYKHHDHVWVRKLDRQLWIDFFRVLGIEISVANENILSQLNQALHILAQRTITFSLEQEITNGLEDVDYNTYSFFQLDTAVQHYLVLSKNGADKMELCAAVENIKKAIGECRQTIEVISENRRRNGTSLSQTYMLFRIEQHLDRLMLISDVLDQDKRLDVDKFFEYFITVIENEKTKNSLRKFLSANFAFLAFKITEHGGTRGEKYITATRQGYWNMLWSAMGGGFIVSFTALVKNLLTKVPMAPFWHGFAYSVNYAAGFQIMHETNTTLATKQPAFTASALAGSLDYFKEYRKPDMYLLAITIARTSRSQLAAFFGNLIIVFPLCYGLAALYHAVTGQLLLDQKAAEHMLIDQHPYMSLSILYACFTGFFLFLSGLIAGYVENGINYGKVGKRLKNHPLFKNTLSPKKLDRVTNYVVNNAGPLVGNIALGFFLGMAGFFGTIFGLPFDIRHITIASGNSAIAYYTTGNAIGIGFLLTVLGGVFLIGLFNFLVSFALAFFVAIKSRGVRLRDYPELVTVVGKFFLKFPFDFIFPPKYPRELDEVKRKFRGFR